jgi:hypothetical protein
MVFSLQNQAFAVDKKILPENGGSKILQFANQAQNGLQIASSDCPGDSGFLPRIWFLQRKQGIGRFGTLPANTMMSGGEFGKRPFIAHAGLLIPTFGKPDINQRQT